MDILDLVGKSVAVSIETLYFSIRDLVYGEIRVDADDERNITYFDLYDEYGDLVCCDGEVCTIQQVNGDIVMFRNENGEETVYFVLTTKEAKEALFLS